MKTLICLLLLLAPIKTLADQTRMGSQSTITASTTSTQYLGANESRNYLLVINRSSVDSIYVKIGSAHSATEGVLIPPGGNWEPINAPLGKVYIKASAGTPSVNLSEGTR